LPICSPEKTPGTIAGGAFLKARNQVCSRWLVIVIYQTQYGTFVKRKAQPLSKRAAQLDGALALVGGDNRVAGYDNVVVRLRAGEVIGRSAGSRKLPEQAKPADKRSDRASS
jgi:hypothetical protein